MRESQAEWLKSPQKGCNTMERKYYEINEKLAKAAHEMMSFSDYSEGSKTEEYKSSVDKAYDLADRISEAKPKQAERAYKIAAAYARRLADNLNASSRIGTMCPSVLIAGPSNFPVKKKERQNAAADRNMQEWNEIQGYIQKLKNILRGKEAIMSDDEDALVLLEEKLSSLEARQELMKEVNAYYRKNKTLDGCPEITAETAQEIEAAMSSEWRVNKKPFPEYELTNNNANIRRIRDRIEQLKKTKSEETSEQEYSALGLTVKMNVEEMRVQFFFEGKPEQKVRELIKGRGFKWSPSNGCWQRLLTPNAKYDTKNILEELMKMQEEEKSV